MIYCGSLSCTFLDAAQFFQILEEPGEDNTKFDNIVPTIVKPKTAEEFNVEAALKGHVS